MSFCFFVVFSMFLNFGTFPDTQEINASTQDSDFSKFPNHQLFLVPDTNANYTIDSLMSFDIPSKHRSMEFLDLSSNVVWAVLSVKNNTDRDQDVILQVAKDFDLGELKAFIVRDGQVIETQKTGHFLTSTKRPVPFTHNAYIRVFLPKEEITKLFLRNQPIPGYKAEFELVFYTIEEWMEQVRSVDFFQSIYHGVLWILMLYSFIVFLQTRDKTFLYYAVYLLSFSFFTGIIYGYLTSFFVAWPWSTLFLFLQVTAIFGYILFAREYIHLSRIARKWDNFVRKSLLVLVTTSVPSTLYVYFTGDIYFMDLFMGITAGIGLFFMITIPLIGIFQKSEAGNYLLLGTVVMVIGMIISYVYMLAGNQTTIFGQLGMLGENLIFVVGLSYKMRENEKIGRLAQQRLIVELKKRSFMKRRMNENLETEVRERTYEVQKQKEDIEQKAKLLVEKNSKLNHANEFKDRLFTIIGHDLRNPIGTLKGVLELHSRGHLSGEDLANISTNLDKSLGSIINMLDNLLMWALHQSEGINYRPDYFSAFNVTQDNIDLLKPQASQKQIELKNEVDRHLLIYGDLEMLRIVIRNLVSNAIKFTNPGGTVLIEAKMDQESTLFSVTDTGEGIPVKDINKLLAEELFTTRGTSKEKGTGLGLRLCQEFVKKNHGEILIESEIGVGSTFTIRLPKGDEIPDEVALEYASK